MSSTDTAPSRPTGAAADAAPAAPRTSLPHLLRSLRGRSWWVAGPLVLYAVLVLLGVTQSSIGITGLREDPSASDPAMIGGAVGIRSDEYLTSTPLLLGITATGSADDQNPLTAPQGFTTQMPSGVVSSVVLFDGTMLQAGPLLPDQMLIAARWWLPFLLLFLGAPAFVHTLTGNRWLGLVAALLIVATPGSAWWSFSPLGILGFTLAGAAAMQRVQASLELRRYGRAAAWCAGGGILLARTPLHYQPWAIVVGLTILAVAIAGMVATRERLRSGLVAVGATGGLALLLAGGVLLENLESIRATLGTSYPGARVAAGSPNQIEEIFGATSLVNLKHLTVLESNPSEVASAFAVAAVWAVLLLVAGVRFRDRGHRVATTTMLGFTGFWFAWSMVEFGGWATHIPLLSMVPANRSTDVLGYLAVLLLCLVLPGAPRAGLRRSALVAGSIALLAAYAGSMMWAHTIPDMSTTTIWVSSLLLGAVVLVVTRRPDWWVGYAAAVALGALLIWNVNPVLFGLADLRGSATAQAMLADGAEARADGEVWATDDLYVDALLTATGVPSLSSRQLAGPVEDAWRELDPTGANELAWNRGGSFITFEWTDAEELVFTNPAPDVIRVSGSPCEVAERLPALTTVVSGRELTDTCLVPDGTITWGGAPRWVYTVTG
ncbi:DUF7657 domain-containing protein [Actinotalea subterranea]|uniref:DUF7657 domain-containing protein n=1 Tax=Actinotalea subterranea TaxID=2607497 RepID=UPI0011EF5F70|nr:hypothetical protein [Actinotalea subterranea]